MPQDMSRAFLITLDRLAFITVLVISRMIDSIRLDSTESRIGSKLSALRDRALAGLALTLVAKLIGRGSSASIGRVWKIGPLRRSRMPASAPVRVPLDRRRHPAARMTGRCARMLCTVTLICQSPEKCKHTKIAPRDGPRRRLRRLAVRSFVIEGTRCPLSTGEARSPREPERRGDGLW